MSKRTNKKNYNSKIVDSDSGSDNLSDEFNKLIDKNQINNETKSETKIEKKILTSEEQIENIYMELNSILQCNNNNNNNRCEYLIGEIITFRYSDPNAYITIKISDYQINGIFWSITKSKNFFEYKKLSDGDKIKIYGNFAISKKNFSIYFNTKSIEKVGLGDYLQLHNQLRNKIIELGWDKNKSELTKFPYSIGIVTAIEGAAIQDILQTFRTDYFTGNIFITNAIVQGKSCPESVSNAISYLESNYPDLDLILITRGGGSYEDLVGFSDWDLITKIKKCPILTMSAIGHQIDNQLSDEVADYKFPTPTFAAKFIVETQKKFINKFTYIKDMVSSLKNKFVTSKELLNKITQNYNQIVNNYNISEYKEKIYKYSNKINQTLNRYHNAKKSYYNFVSNMKPTIIKNNKEVVSIHELLDSPKKMDIVLPDGNIKVSYKVLEQNL